MGFPVFLILLLMFFVFFIGLTAMLSRGFKKRIWAFLVSPTILAVLLIIFVVLTLSAQNNAAIAYLTFTVISGITLFVISILNITIYLTVSKKQYN